MTDGCRAADRAQAVSRRASQAPAWSLPASPRPRAASTAGVSSADGHVDRPPAAPVERGAQLAEQWVAADGAAHEDQVRAVGRVDVAPVDPPPEEERPGDVERDAEAPGQPVTVSAPSSSPTVAMTSSKLNHPATRIRMPPTFSAAAAPTPGQPARSSPR